MTYSCWAEAAGGRDAMNMRLMQILMIMVRMRWYLRGPLSAGPQMLFKPFNSSFRSFDVMISGMAGGDFSLTIVLWFTPTLTLPIT